MKNILKLKNLIFLMFPFSNLYGAEVALQLKETISELGDVKENIAAVGKLPTQTGLGRQTVAAEQSFARASEAFSKSQWLTVLQETQRFLTLSQKPDPQLWMRAHYMLGRAYEERGQPGRSARAYLRYLSTFVTAKSPQYSELTDVLEHLVRVGTKGTGTAKAELKQFLSSIAAMKVPEEIEPELKYFTAIGSSNIGQKNLATSWLADLDKGKGAPDIKARAHLFNALLSMQEAKWEKAEEALQSVLTISGIPQKTTDSARLSLARVYLKLKKPKTALKIYESIGKDSESYREALFEKVYANIRENQGKEARSLAAEFLEKYPDHYDATKIRSLVSWLEIHQGDLNAAKASIVSTQKGLEELRGKVTENLSGKLSLSHMDIASLVQLTYGEVVLPTELTDILAMFEQLSDLELRLSEVEGGALNSLYAIAKIDLEHYSPQLANRIEQVSKLIQSHMKIADKLVQTESSRLSDRLSKIDKQKLASSSRRRTNLFSKETKLSIEAKRWLTWGGPAEQLSALATVWNKQQAVEVKSKTLSKEESAGSSEAERFSAKIRSEMLGTLTDIRRLQASNLVEQSKLKELQFIMEQFESAIVEDQALFTSYEPNETQTLDALDDEDTQRAWELYRINSKNISSVIRNLRTDADAQLKASLAGIDQILSRQNKLRNDIFNIKDVLEKQSASAAPALLAHFDGVIGQRIARQQKWLGDVDYLEYTQKTDEHKSIRKSRDLEIQVLSDNLREQDAGVMQWPR